MNKHSNTVLMITTGVFLLVRRFVGRTPAGRANLLKAFPQKTGQYRDTFSSIISNVVSSTASTRARRCLLPVGHHGHGQSTRGRAVHLNFENSFVPCRSAAQDVGFRHRKPHSIASDARIGGHTRTRKNSLDALDSFFRREKGPGRAHSGHRRSERLERTHERP